MNSYRNVAKMKLDNLRISNFTSHENDSNGSGDKPNAAAAEQHRLTHISIIKPRSSSG